MSIIEHVSSSEDVSFDLAQGLIRITRKFVTTKSSQENSYTLHTNICKRQGQPIASICLVHGNSECSDSFFEVGIHHALNGFDVHMIDLKGFGMASGEKHGHYVI